MKNFLNLSRNPKKLVLSSIEPGRIRKKGEGMFIHLTFQEYFAAEYLAHLYKENRNQAKELVREIKFEPRYRLVLYMAAGVLSDNHQDENALKSFFNDLFSEPYDLAENYELNLISRCFQECKNPQLIPQFKNFIKKITNYIQNCSLITPVEEMLYKNQMLLAQPEITTLIVAKIRDPRERRFMLQIPKTTRKK